MLGILSTFENHQACGSAVTLLPTHMRHTEYVRSDEAIQECKSPSLSLSLRTSF